MVRPLSFPDCDALMHGGKNGRKRSIDPRDQGAQGGGDAGGRGEEEESLREVKVVVAEEKA